MYVAHRTEDGRTQSMNEHLENVGRLAEEYVQDDFKALAYTTGKIHDLGKYSDMFQERINGNMSIRVEHAICGAKEVDKLFPKNYFSYLMKYCVAGHHTGLPDGGTNGDDEDLPTLFGRMKRICEDYSAYKTEIDITEPKVDVLLSYIKVFLEEAGQYKKMDRRYISNIQNAIELYAFFTRYIFSSITDADFIDTESFFNPEYDRGIQGNFKRALELLNTYMTEHFNTETVIRKARAELQNQAFVNAKNAGNISILNMPTGSGKTLCSIKIALEMAIRENKKHIIYVIPYTSIIEQTAKEFEKIFGEDLYVLQNHSNFIIDDGDDNTTTAQKLKRTCENWDAPLIVTTSVQFFESLYHYKSSRLRKLHNLTDAIIIFDEVHMIPIECLQPCIRGIGYITEYLNSKAIFLSATIPDYSRLFDQFIPGAVISELITDKSTFKLFEKCHYNNMGHTSFEDVVIKASEYNSSLIVVNRRKDARNVYNMINGKKYHLSTYMTPIDRMNTIDEIKISMSRGEHITVVSTSLIEAGVDLDFESAFRQLAGLDSIIQTAGRCNREGIRDIGEVFIFEPEDYKVQTDLQTRINTTRGIINKSEDIVSDSNIKYYFDEIFTFNEDSINKNSIAIDENGKLTNISSLQFRSYAEKFSYIRSDTIAIVIPNDKNQDLIESLKYGSKVALRKLQPYSVSVYRYELDVMMKLGVIKIVDDVYVLSNENYYSKEIGLDYLSTEDELYFV